MEDSLLKRINIYEQKIEFYANNKERVKKYKGKINDILRSLNQHGGDTDDDLKLLRKMELKNSDNDNVSLLEYQEDHAEKLIRILNSNGAALDASDPGIGKTYIASYICKSENLRPIVICPKNVISSWIKVLKMFDVDFVTVTNYELFVRGKQLNGNVRHVSPYVKMNTKKKKASYEWSVDENVIFIFDEAHKCKFISTGNAKLLLGAKETGNKILMLSATIVEKPKEFAMFGYILGMSQSLQLLVNWINKLTTPAKTIHTLLYDGNEPKASRLTISELGDKFPDTQITADTYTMKQSSEISEEYKKIALKIKKFKEEGDKSKFMIAKLQSEFRNIELLKIPTFVELAEDYIENNYSVVIFVNYTETLLMLADKLNTKSLIHGGQSKKERDECIENFQNDKTRIIISNIKAGGVGISLHDINGTYPRVSLISPTQSATNLIQALGRIYRSGGKTKSLQRIIFAANTPEDDISRMLFRKLSNLSLLNDGDMESYYIDGLIEDKQYSAEQQKYSKDDMKIHIDEQLERIKNKNFKKTNKMSDLFPHVIDTISGVRNAYLLKSKNFFDGKEIFLLGENHTELKPCTYCRKNCLEVLDLITYTCNSMKPHKIDFYLENEYIPKLLQNNFDDRNETPTRLVEFYNYYRHLINSKNPTTENVRLHVVDVRIPPSKYEDDILEAFGVLMYISYEIFGYIADDIFYERLKPSNITLLKFKKNKQLFEKLREEFEYVNNYLQKNPDLTIIKKILSGHDDIFDKLKLTKQRERFLENYNGNVDSKNIAKSIHDQIFNNIENVLPDSISFIKRFSRALNSIQNEPSLEKYMISFVNLFVKEEHNDQMIYFEESGMLMATLASYMDYYTIFRMLRKFDDNEQKNVIFYGGYQHSKNIFKILQNTGYFNTLMYKRDDPNTQKQHDCQLLD
jgi:superfamily II DNA or RNA helicase